MKELFKINTVSYGGSEITVPFSVFNAVRANDMAIGNGDETLYAEMKIENFEHYPAVVIASLAPNGKVKVSKVNVVTRRAFDVEATTSNEGERSKIRNLLQAATDAVIVRMLIQRILESGVSRKSDVDETIKSFKILKDLFSIDPSDATTENIEDITAHCTKMMNLISSAVESGQIKFQKKEFYPVLDMTIMEAGVVGPKKIIEGEFITLKKIDDVEEVPSFSKEELVNRFRITEGRKFTEEELKMMWQIPDHIEVSSNAISIAEKIKASWARPSHLRKVNVLLEGANGTGKTIDSKVLSALLGLPYTKITCFSDMDGSDVTEKILPRAKDKDEMLVLPTDSEIEFDTVGVYEQLTGITKEDVSIEEVKKVIELKKKSFIESQNDTTPEYVNYPSEIVKAFENGWLVEVQERATRLAVKSCYTIESIQ